MSPRLGICRLLVCLVFVLSSSYAQAMSHVDQANANVQAKSHLPPCHHVSDDEDSKKGAAHHGGCCSNFACCLGLATESVILSPVGKFSVHDVDPVRVMHSASHRPLFPPPKSV